MATIEQIQEIANRGIQDQLPPDKKAKFDELVRRGTITLPGAQAVQNPRADFSGADEFGRPPVATPRPPVVDPEKSVIDKVEDIGLQATALMDAGVSIASSAVAEPAAGIGGTAKTITSGPEEGEKTIKAIREKITFIPRSQESKDNLEATGKFLKPLGIASAFAQDLVGEFIFDKTKSPAAAAFAASWPAAATEIFGAKGAGIVKKAQGRKGTKIKEGEVSKIMEKAAPSIDELKTHSRAIFDEIAESGGVVNPDAIRGLGQRVREATAEFGASGKTAPGVMGLVDDLDNLLVQARTKIDPVTGKPIGGEFTLKQLDDMRSQFNALRKDQVQGPAAGAAVDAIDAFMDEAGDNTFIFKNGDQVNLGRSNRFARQLWGQAKRSELVGEAFEKATLQASGFENGVRIQFRQIINNKNKRRFFSKPELKAMREVVEGSRNQNIFKLLGGFGFSEGQSINMVRGLLGLAAGKELAGAKGAIAVATAGQLFKKLAGVSTNKGADFADSLIRSGKNAKKITRAYLKSFPKGQRNIDDLAKLFLERDVDLKTIEGLGKVAREAADRAEILKAQGFGAVAAGSQVEKASGLTEEGRDQGSIAQRKKRRGISREDEQGVAESLGFGDDGPDKRGSFQILLDELF